MDNKPRVISLFSGAGGLDLGFKTAGYDIIWANDCNLDAVNTYKKNIGDHITAGDIRQIPSESIPDNPDIIIGGFPCQGFSVNNTNRSMKDSRNFLYLELLRLIKDKQPKFFVAENVRGLLSMCNGDVIKMILNDFRKLGYHTTYKLINALNYGVPQDRERVIIIGNKLGIDNPYPEPTHTILAENQTTLFTIQKAVTTKEAIGFLSDIPLSDTKIIVNGREIYNHTGYTNTNDTYFKREYNIEQSLICDYLQKYRKLAGIPIKKFDEIFGYKDTASHWFRKDGTNGNIPNPNEWMKLKEILKFDDTYDKEVTTLTEEDISFEQHQRITKWDKPSATITASQPEIHINGKRRLSVRECAIIQSFPDNFIFTGAISSMYHQIGNAVPPLLGFKIAESIRPYL